MSPQQKNRSNHKRPPGFVQLAENRVQGGCSAQHTSVPSPDAEIGINKKKIHTTDETTSRVPGPGIFRQTQRVMPGNIQGDRSKDDRQQNEVIQE